MSPDVADQGGVCACTCARMFTHGGVGDVAGDLESLPEGLAEGAELFKNTHKRSVEGKEGTRGWQVLYEVLDGNGGAENVELNVVGSPVRRTSWTLANLHGYFDVILGCSGKFLPGAATTWQILGLSSS